MLNLILYLIVEGVYIMRSNTICKSRTKFSPFFLYPSRRWDYLPCATICIVRFLVAKIIPTVIAALLTLTHLYNSALKFFFKYLDSAYTATASYSTRYVSLSSGHVVRLGLNTQRVPSKRDSCEAEEHVQFATEQGTHLVRSADGLVPGEQRTHDFVVNGDPLISVSTVTSN